MSSDGLGGAYFAWNDLRFTYYGYATGVQHIGASGAPVSGWPSDGLQLTPIALGGTSDYLTAIVPDGSGGAFFGWSDLRNDRADDFYMQHLTASGTPAPGWVQGGVPIAAGPGGQGGVTPLISDGIGGVTAVWSDGRPGAPGIYMEHLLGDGTPAPGSVAGGTRVASGKGLIGAVSDGSGGLYLGLGLGSSLHPGLDSTYYLLRVTGTGAVVPGWPPNGTLVCTADFVRTDPHIAADGAGRVFLVWQDSRGHGYSHVYATQWNPDGTLAPGWISNGSPVSTFPGHQIVDDVLVDGSGGVFIAGEYDAGGGDYGFIQRMGGDGQPAPGWSATGSAFNATPNQHDARMTTDGAGGTIVVWGNGYAGVYANHYAGDSPTATLLSLASSDARPDRVSLLWQGDGASTASASVERGTEASGWEVLGTPSADGPDRLRYEDRAVAAGARYAYRLRYLSDGSERLTPEAWVAVPAAPHFALGGLRPNPSRGSDLRVAFSLVDASPARLELIDVSGRRIAAREVDALGPGEHVEPLQADARVSAGLYWVRLTQGSRSLVTRAVVTE